MIPHVNLRDPAFKRDKYGEIERLRSLGPYAHIDGGFVFFNQDDAVHVLRCRDFAFSFFQIDPGQSPYLAASIEHELLNKHGVDHERLKLLVLSALRDRIVEDLTTRIENIVHDLIDAMPTRGTVDFRAALAEPLPARVLGPMFDVPYEDTDGLADWIRIGGRKVDALQSGVGLGEVEDANRKMHDYFRALLANRRQAPGDDIFGQLMLAEIDGDRLSEDELVALTSELASAGVDTTQNQLPLILDALMKHPDQLATLRANPDLALRAVEEGMRYAPLPWALPHKALRDHVHNGAEIKSGDLIMVLIPAVCRDPNAVERPDEFDINRPRVRNFGFGYGMHACPGAHLARLEMAVALRIFLERTKSFRLVADPPRDPVQKGEAPLELQLEIEKL